MPADEVRELKKKHIGQGAAVKKIRPGSHKLHRDRPKKHKPEAVVKLGKSPELSFVKALAHNDVKIRDKAVKRLRQWLRKRTGGHSDQDLLKLWKGLFYCMWMSDKPLVQEELARRLAALVHVFPDDGVPQFLSTFFTTIEREWQGVDRLRIDKYYNLVTQVVKEAFKWVASKRWDAGAIETLNAVFVAGPLRIKDHTVPLGLPLHISEIYVHSARDAAGAAVRPAVTQLILKPVLATYAGSKHKVLLERIETAVVFRLVEDEARRIFIENDGGCDVDGTGAPAGCVEVDWESLAAEIFALAADEKTHHTNRQRLYEMNRKLKKEVKGLTDTRADHQAASNSVTDGASSVGKKRKVSDEGSAAAVSTSTAPTSVSHLETDTTEVKPAKKAKKSSKKEKASAKPALSQPEAVKPATLHIQKKASKKEVAKNVAAGSAVATQPETAEPGVVLELKRSKRGRKAEVAEEASASTPQPTTPDVKQGLKSALSTPRDFTARRSSRIQESAQKRRISWGKDQVRPFDKKLAPSSVSKKNNA